MKGSDALAACRDRGIEPVVNGPFGGFRNSGIGRNFGYEGVIQFQGYHSIAGAPGTLV